MAFRYNLSASEELKNIVVADAVLILAFSLSLSGGISGLVSVGGIGYFLWLIPMVALGVTLSFVLHELMHKFVAQRFGAIAAFRRSDNGIMITLVTSLFGFLVGLPGATVIYAPHFTRKEDGYVSLAGPLANFVVFAVFFTAGSLLFPHFSNNVMNVLSTTRLSAGAYLQAALGFTVFISIYLAFFNMLPIFPLDGSKVFAWDLRIWLAAFGFSFLAFSMFGL